MNNVLKLLLDGEALDAEQISKILAMSKEEVEAELEEVMPVFTQADPYPKPMLVEVFTDAAEDVRLLKDYYHQLKADRANS